MGKKGISLIVLIITIIVIIILAGAVILSLANNNPIDEATEAKFKENVRTYQAELSLWLSKEYIKAGGIFNVKEVNASVETGSYQNLKMQDIIQNMNDKQGGYTQEASKFMIKEGILIYSGENQEEKEWAEEIGIVHKPSVGELEGVKVIKIAKENVWEIEVETGKQKASTKISYKKQGETEWKQIENLFTINEGGIYEVKVEQLEKSHTEILYLYEPKGLQLYLDAIENTSENTSIWKDLGYQKNDMQLYGFDQNTTSGWQKNYLALDGINDYGATTKPVEYKQSNVITVETIDINASLTRESRIACVFESSSTIHVNKGSYHLYMNQVIERGLDFVTNSKSDSSGINASTSIDIRTVSNLKCDTYTMLLNCNKPYNTYMNNYINGTKHKMEPDLISKADLSTNIINDYIFYMGGRVGENYFAKMNIGAFRVYNRELTEEEIQINREIDQIRFNQ